jgi:hypothetical protein
LEEALFDAYWPGGRHVVVNTVDEAIQAVTAFRLDELRDDLQAKVLEVLRG